MMHPDNEYLLRYMDRLRSYAERYGMPFENDTALDFDWCLEMVDRAEQKGKEDAECEYTYKVMKKISEADVYYITVDHLIKVLEECKEQLKEKKNDTI